MKKAMAFLAAALLVLLPACTTKAGAVDGWQQACEARIVELSEDIRSRTLESMREMTTMSEAQYSEQLGKISFALLDYTGDGVPELLLRGTEAMVYTMDRENSGGGSGSSVWCLTYDDGTYKSIHGFPVMSDDTQANAVQIAQGYRNSQDGSVHWFCKKYMEFGRGASYTYEVFIHPESRTASHIAVFAAIGEEDGTSYLVDGEAADEQAYTAAKEQWQRLYRPDPALTLQESDWTEVGSRQDVQAAIQAWQ